MRSSCRICAGLGRGLLNTDRNKQCIENNWLVATQDALLISCLMDDGADPH